jgi:hypothetical protein
MTTYTRREHRWGRTVAALLWSTSVAMLWLLYASRVLTPGP